MIALAAVMGGLVIAHVRGLNGPWYWTWTWRRLPVSIYPILLGASAPFFVGQRVYARFRTARGIKVALALVMLSTLTLQLAAISVQPLGLRRIGAIVRSSVNTSYYDAAKVLTEQMDRGASYRDWIEIYPQLMPKLMLHAGYKPPGLIFYYILFIRIFGAGSTAATVAGLTLGLLACASVGATYFLLRTFLLDEDSAFCGASYFALTPSLIGFFPQADQAYPLLAIVLLALWIAALRKRSAWLAIGFGGWLTVLLLLSPTFLMFGAFLGIYTLLRIKDRGGAELGRAIMYSAWAGLVIVALYLLIWVVVRFDPIATFNVAAERSQAHLVQLQRPWPLHSLFDVIDIALGTGWMSFPLAALGVIALWRQHERRRDDSPLRLVLLGLLQVAAAVAVAVFPGENARLMLPMMPLLLAPVGVELSRWSRPARMVVYLLLILTTAAFIQNMIPLYMGPEIEGVHKV